MADATGREKSEEVALEKPDPMPTIEEGSEVDAGDGKAGFCCTRRHT